MEPKPNFKFRLQLLEISTILNTLSIENLKKIIIILNITSTILTKESIIDNILTSIKEQNKEEIYKFRDIIENIRYNQNNNNNFINQQKKTEDSMNDDQTEKSEISLNSKFKNFNLGDRVKAKKRTYNEMIKKVPLNANLSKENITEEQEVEDNTIKNKKIKKKKIYPKFLNNEQDKHYYYIDNNNEEWQWLEINGTIENFYFKCTSKLCSGFGMIKRKDNDKIFKLTKKHNLEYYKHPYYIKIVSLKNIIKDKITEEQWKEEKIRYNLFKTYFMKNPNSNDEECKMFFKIHLKEIFNVTEEINKEIKKSRMSANYTKNSYNNIIYNLENLKDYNNDKIIYVNKYKHFNKIRKEDEEMSMYFIINKRMYEEFKNSDIYQYFGDATYRCVPPTLRNYKLYAITGFNFIVKRTRLLSLILIPNETEITYFEMFNYLKNNFGFKPKIFTMDFNKASSKAIKRVYPSIYLIKCFFHYVYNIWNHFNRYGLNNKDNMKDLYELAFNLKMLCFVNPDNIIKIYKKIEKKFNKKQYKEFFKYYERSWKPKGHFKNIKFIPEFNYYNVLNSIEFDIKYLFLTNNIAEHLNKLLNAKLNSKYPVFNNWKNAILKVEEEVNNSVKVLDRSDYISRLFLFFISWFGNNKSKTDLLDTEDIKKLNTIILEDKNVGNHIPFSEFFNLKIDIINSGNYMENSDNKKNTDFLMSNDSDNSSDIIDEDEDHNIGINSGDKKENDNNINIFNNFTEDKELSYNIQKYVNDYKLNNLLKELEI